MSAPPQLLLGFATVGPDGQAFDAGASAAEHLSTHSVGQTVKFALSSPTSGGCEHTLCRLLGPVVIGQVTLREYNHAAHLQPVPGPQALVDVHAGLGQLQLHQDRPDHAH